MAFDVQGARAAGYSDAEIADYIAPDYDFDTRGARGAGYSDAEILDHLLKLDQPAPAPAKAKQPTLPTEPETDEERIQRYRDSDAAGAPISAPMTQQEVDQWGETIRDIPTQVRATAAQTLAGMKAREFAELEGAPSLYKGDRGKSQEQIDAERRERTQSELAVAREAGADLAEIAAKDRTLGQRAVGGAATSLVQTALPMAVGIATRNPVVAAATMQPTTAGQTFAELANEYEDQRSAPPAAVPEQVQQDRSYSPEARTADLKRAALHGDIQGFLESGTEMLPFTKLFKRGTQPMNRLVEFLVQEIPGESVATVTQAIDDVIARSPPGVTVEEVMQGMQQGFEQLPETWATTLLAGGAQSGAVSLAESAARRAQHPPEEEDATFESVPDVPRLPAGTQINVDSAGTARTSESQRAEQDAVTAERDYQRDLGMEEVAGAVQGRAPIEIPEQRRLPASIPIEVDSDGTARTAESRRTEQAQASAEAQRRRDLGLNEVSRVVRPQEESSRPVEAQARPQATQNVELYQYQRTSKDLRGRQAEVRQITEEEFQQYIRPVLSDGVANSLEEYHAKYPSATHVRLRRTPKGIVLDQVGDAAAIRPSGPDVRRVAAFEDEDAKQFAIARVAQERAAPNRVNPETDSVLTAVSKLGGLSREEAVALGIEPKHLTHRGHGINLSFRRSGKKFTEMAQALQELGYAITDQSALHEAISQELSGSKATAGVKLAQPAAEVKRDEHETVRPVQAATPAEAPAPAVQVPAAEHRPQQAARAAGHAAAAADTGVATQADETPVTDIDVAAHAAATSPTNDRPEPTDAQKEAGNYAKGHVRLHGLDISIENPRGSTRRSKEGVSPAWEVEMPVHYGYVRGTIGADGEHIDISLGGQPENDARPVFVFDQGNGDGSFDEHKVFLGFHDEVDARRFYRQSFAGDFGKTMLDERLWGVKRFSLNEFKAWLANGDLKKPASGAVRGPLRNGEALPVEKPADPKAARKDWAAELGIPKGTKVRTTKAVGYLGANEEYNVEWVSKTRAYFRNIVTKGGTDLLKFDIQRAIKEGAIVPQSAEALAESTPVKTPISTGEKPTPDYEARWNSLDYGKRQDLAQQSGYGSMRAVVHRISGSKWAQLSPGEQTEMASAMESAEKAPTESVKPADSPRQKEPVTPQLPPAAGVAVPLDAQGPVVDDRMAQQIRDLDRTIAEDEADAAPTEDVSGPTPEHSKQLADWVKGHFAGRKAFTWDELFKAANLAFGGTQAEGKYSPKDAYDAVELGVNLYLRNTSLKPDGDVEAARTRVENLGRLLDLIPTQTKRTEEQDEFQQFSTPPSYAYVANWAASIRAGETYIEPSAGIGGLAVFGLNAGAKVVVNELSPRRAALLKSLGFDRVLTENAEQLDNVLPADITPTIIVMNPPFSSTAGRIRGERKTLNGAKHIEQALKRIDPNGRLVAIVGEGMADDRPAFRDWWSRIKQQYNVRANIGIDGRGYAKYGTTFDNQLLVIDKTGPTTAAVLTGKFGSVAEVIPQLEGIRNDRPAATSQDHKDVQQPSAERGGESPASRRLEGSHGAAGRVVDAVGHQGGRDRSAGESVSAGQRDAGELRGADERGKPATRDGSADEGRRRADAQSGRTQPSEVAGGRGEATTGSPASESGSDGGVAVKATVEARHEGQLTNSVFEQYRPQRLAIAGAKEHPGKLVQSAAMASVSPPAPTYTPNLPRKVTSDGMLSLAQLEADVYAGQSHEQTLLSGERRGFFIGDGTGVGKGREIGGIILDNLRRGRKKAVWISEKRGLMKDAQRDFDGVGGDKRLIFWHGNTKAAQPIAAEDGILFSTYATLRSEEKRAANDSNPNAPKTRLQQLIDWFGTDYDGVVVFDEAHNAGNAIDMKGKRGVRKASEQALAVVALQKALPQARVVYVSATGATEVSNLSYATRLGVWGPGAPFESVEKFISEVSRGGLAAMELVARDLKQMGLYIARSLSFDDVTYSRLEHPLTEIQRDIYNELAKAWQIVLQNVHEALKTTGVTKDNGKSLNGLAKGKALSAFWGAHQRFFNQVVTSMQMPSVLDQMHKDIDEGHAVVLQLVNTNEATQERKLAGRDEEDDLDDLDLTPRENLIQYIKNSFPVLQYEEYGEAGNKRSRPVTDSAGNLVMSKEAIAMRDKLVENLEAIRVPDGPLEIVLNEFGSRTVAEVTGRRRRVVRDEKGKTVIENRGRVAAQADADAFQADKKRILIFSDAGGTGFSFQADLTKPNQRRRMHYLIQPGWRADKAVQGFGRTHRTNQKSAPHYRLVTTDLPAQKRFISSIARRLDQLGALTKGQRDTANQGLFSAKDNLESEYASDAIHQLVTDAYANKIKGMPFQQFARELGFDSLIDEKTGGLNTSKIPPVPQFLNRLLSLTTETQTKVFNEFASRMEALVDQAIENGTLDVGMETLRALDVKVKREDVVYSDPKTGAETKYVELELTQKTEKDPFPRRAATAYLRNKKSSKVWVQLPAGKETTDGGMIVDRYRLVGTLSTRYITAPDLLKEQDRYERIKQGKAEELWQAENDQLPPTYTESAHLIVGAILPIWDRLPGHIRVVRTQSSDGRRYLGRYINQYDLPDVLKRLSVQSAAAKMKPAEVVRAILAGAEGELVNGWKLKRARVSNENRIEVETATWVSSALRDELKTYGLFFERIEWNERLFVPVGPAGDAAMTKLLASKPLAEIKNPDDDGGGDDGGVSLSVRDEKKWTDKEIDLERQKIAFRDKHSMESLKAHVDGIAKRWTGVSGLTVEVLDNEYHLPAKLARIVMERGAIGKTVGLMNSYTGTAYLFRDNTTSLDEFESVLFHEVEGHLSIRQFFGDELVPFLNRVAMVDPKGMKEIGIAYGFYDEDGNPANGNERVARLLAADEYIAFLAERVNSNQRPGIRKLWDWLVSHFAELARRAGWKTLKPTETEIRGWLIRAQRNLRARKPQDIRKPDSNAAKGSDSVLREEAALRLRTEGGSRASWDSPEPSRLDNLIYTLQDKHIDLKRVQEAIRAMGDGLKELADDIDAYLKEEMFHGRVATRLLRFLTDELKPFLQRVKLAGVTLDEIEHYLHARHARERNDQIATINPDMPDGGSGMTNADAASYMASLTPSQRQRFEQLARIVDGMTQRTRQTLVGYGLESQATVDTWARAYRNYVPLNREDMDMGPGTGQGFSVRGPSGKRAMGSERRVVNIIANIAMQRERALVRGEKNRVANSLVGLAQANPNPDFWKVDQPPTIRYVDPRTNLVTQTIDLSYKSKDNVVVARMIDDNGNVVEHAVVFNPNDERASRMAASLKNIDVDQLEQWLSMMAKVTRYFAAMSTQYNPIWGLMNLERDVLGALLNLTTTHLDGDQRQILMETVSALRGIYIDARAVRRGEHPTSVWAQLWEEFQMVGGQTGYRDMFRTSNDRARAIQAELKQMSEGQTLHVFHYVRDWLSDFNLAMENAVRLAVYKAGKENHHLSNERAASIAKNITVNFNRRGQASTKLGALYAFFNANAQGTARLLQTLGGPKGKAIIAGGIFLGVAQALWMAAAGFDEDDPPEFVRERNFVIPLPGSDRKYLLVAYPLGLHILPTIGRLSTELALKGFRGAAGKVSNLMATTLEAFNPVGSTGSLTLMLSPTVTDPLVSLELNKDWTGKPIYREDMNSLKPTPGHTRARDSASNFSMVTSRIINGLTGGTDYVPGTLSPTPDQIDYLIGQAFGGVGREAGKTLNLADNLLSGELPPAYRVPLLGRIYGDAGDASSYSGRFYELVKRANMHKAEIEGRAKHGGDYIAYLHDNPEARSAAAVVKAADLVSRMRTAKREAEASGNHEAARQIEQAITNLMRDAVEGTKEARKSAAP